MAIPPQLIRGVMDLIPSDCTNCASLSNNNNNKKQQQQRTQNLLGDPQKDLCIYVP